MGVQEEKCRGAGRNCLAHVFRKRKTEIITLV